MNPDFYRAFEDRYRGSRDLIASRLRFYLPFIEPLKVLHGVAALMDLGCGRGEWLELTGANGFQARGVDLDDSMLQACHALGLDARACDAIHCLKQLPAESQSVVSGFHLVEHLPFSEVQTLIAEALRVLKPAGLLILETPNPENLVVGTSAFYLDPTHNKPLPPALLSFAVEFAGFPRVKTVRLQEDRQLATRPELSLVDVLYGVSPDYGVIAQKGGSSSQLAAWNDVFEVEYGCTLEALAARYDRSLVHLQQFRAAIEQAVGVAAEAHANAAIARAAADQATEGLAAMQRSVSWRITRPLRWVRRLLRGKDAAGAEKDSSRS